MAKVLFASGTVGAIVLPLMLFHQMQLMVCGAGPALRQPPAIGHDPH
jgi:predicted Na+-dependent transporter